MSKYGNRKVQIDGYTFDSQAEARRYGELKLLERAGEIKRLVVHPVYSLLAAFTDLRGRKHRELTYEADFEYVELATGLVVVEDVKGVKTEVFRIKEKLLCHKLPARWVLRTVEAQKR